MSGKASGHIPVDVSADLGTLVSGTVTNAPLYWNGTDWVNGFPPLRNPNISLGANGAETFPRKGVNQTTAIAIGASGVMTCYEIDLYAGMTITSLSFKTGATAATSPTHWWVALYDSSGTPALLKQSADQATTAIASTTAYTLSLSTPQAITVTGAYYACLMVAASVQPSLSGIGIGTAYSTGLASGEKILAGTSGSSLTTTAPSTIASLTAITGQGYMVTA